MAIENFEGKNIQDTFQRVVQTDGTNQLADGTGSIFIPVSSSHAITASHALFAVSASHEITFELSSSHAVSADTASFATNFTASGNISASGDITANSGSFNRISASGNILGSNVIANDLLFAQKISVLGSDNTHTHTFIGNITASGNVRITSADPNLRIEDTNGRSVEIDVTDDIFRIDDVGNNAAIFTTDLSTNPTQTTFQTKPTFLRDAEFEGSISASGNITASGNIRAGGEIIGTINGGTF
jgi:cytoskeletal protein CcmA (bactofilin family)